MTILYRYFAVKYIDNARATNDSIDVSIFHIPVSIALTRHRFHQPYWSPIIVYNGYFQNKKTLLVYLNTVANKVSRLIWD